MNAFVLDVKVWCWLDIALISDVLLYIVDMECNEHRDDTLSILPEYGDGKQLAHVHDEVRNSCTFCSQLYSCFRGAWPSECG